MLRGLCSILIPSALPLRLAGKFSSPVPTPARCRMMMQMDPGVHTRSWQGSVLRRCLILLHLCTASPRLWVWVPQLHPSPEPKAFHHKAIECFLPPQKGGVCCKPSTFPSSHSPLSRSTVCLKSSPLTSDSRRAVFLPSLSSPCLYYLWSRRFFFYYFFFKHCSCCSLEAGRKAAALLSQP